jgi:hypothetical protein
MNIRSQARSLLIQAATLARMDEFAFRVQKRSGGSRALVIGMHETPASSAAKFREQLEWASQHFTIASLENLAKLWEQHSDSQANLKRPVLFTFDDGRESNYTVATLLLRMLDIHVLASDLAAVSLAQRLENLAQRGD